MGDFDISAAATVYTLAFEEPALAGLEVRVREATVGELAEISAWSRSPRETGRGERMADLFAGALLGWNLTDNGTPVPANRDGFERLGGTLGSRLVAAWIRETAGVAPPLPPTSSAGQPALEESIPMETS